MTTVQACARCGGGGVYYWGTVTNGVPQFSGTCFRCGGTGDDPGRSAPVATTTTRPAPTGWCDVEQTFRFARAGERVVEKGGQSWIIAEGEVAHGGWDVATQVWRDPRDGEVIEHFAGHDYIVPALLPSVTPALDEGATYLAHIARERDRLEVTGDTRSAGLPVLLEHGGVTVFRVYKDGEPILRLFVYATRPVRDEFDQGTFDVRTLDTWGDAVKTHRDVDAAIRAAIVAAIDAGLLP